MRDRITERLALCLDRLERGEITIEECLRLFPEDRAELELLLHTAVNIRTVGQVKLRPQFVSYSRHRLTKLLGPQSPVTFLDRLRYNLRDLFIGPLTARPALSYSIVAAVGLALASVFTVQAANEALPGTPLYPVKLSIEQARIAVASNQQDVVLQLEFAEERDREIRALTETGQYTQLLETEQQYNALIDQATQGAISVQTSDQEWNEHALVNITEALDRHIEVMSSVIEKAPESAKPALENVINKNTLKRYDLLERLREKEDEESLQSLSPTATATATASTAPTGTATRLKPTKKASKTPVPVETEALHGNQNDTPGPEQLNPTRERGRPTERERPTLQKRRVVPTPRPSRER